MGMYDGDAEIPTPRKRKPTDEEIVAEAVRKGKVYLAIIIVVGLMFLFSGSFIVVVPAGTVGVQDTFGVVNDNVLQSGFYLKNPFTSVIAMSTRTAKYMDYGNSDTATITALSNDGLSTTMGIAVNYHLVPTKAPEVYKRVGVDYPSVVMVNPIHAVPRDLISKYDTKTLYSASSEGTADRAKLEQELYDGIQRGINEMGVADSIVIEQVSIRNIDFPAVYKTAIEQKMKMDTEIKQKELEVKKQEMESNRMRAEAQGIADSNQIISSSLTSEYLEWYWIQSMEKNPKTIYVPSENGMPLFKNVDSADEKSAAAAAAA